MPLRGRSITVVGDLSPDEQWFLYRKTAELKRLWTQGGDIRPFRIDRSELAAYLMFFEDSTRTKESFRNAALFHGLTSNVFDTGSSSFNKKESLSDTLKMLVGYNRESLFVIRSTLEGVCRHLDEHLQKYTQGIGLPKPIFLNAGDGRHEHPTQEFLDEFTFLEALDWNRSEIHLALVGDLYHGRTVHSKADGLKVFERVKVDLVAPPELAMPAQYLQKMRDHGFEIRLFATIEEYLAQEQRARLWYFTRLQLERMGDELLDKQDYLRQAVTIQESQVPRLVPGTKFFHPLPQNRTAPTIPETLADTSLNGWDEQSRNGFFTRLVLMGLVAGDLSREFTGKGLVPRPSDSPFIEEVKLGIESSEKEQDFKTGIKRIENGVVIDHIGRGLSVPEIWKLLDKIRRNLDLNYLAGQGVFASGGRGRRIKGIISIPNLDGFDEKRLKMLAALSPECTLNVVRLNRVVRKYRLHMPPRVYNFKEICCRNENCISHPRHNEPVKSEFYRSGQETFVCKYCDRLHTYQEIWTS